MENEIRKAFDQLQAEPQLTEDTQRYLDQVRREKQRRQRSVPLRRALCAAALCCLVLALAGGYRLYFTPTSVISIDINPSIELEVNRFDRVIAVEGRNEDGQALADTLDVLYLEYGPAVEQVLASPSVTACLEEDGFLSIAVVQSDEKQGQQILEYVSACTAHTPNSHCYGIQHQQAEEAHSLGLSYGKYLVYLQLQQYGAGYTPQQVNDMPMSQLRQILEQLQGGASDQSSGHQGQGSHGHHGGHD